MTIERWFEMPRSMTFLMPKTRKWVEDRLEGQVLNLFGGMTRLTYAGEIDYNDLNPGIPADLRLDACDPDLWANMAASYDTIIFDPPYSFHQAVVTYGMKRKQKVSLARDVVEFVLRPGGRVISLGWNSTGMSASRGFEKEALLLVNHGGSHNDTIILSERRV